MDRFKVSLPIYTVPNSFQVGHSFSAYPLNNDREIVELKIFLSDATNSTHLGTHRSRMLIDELAKIIVEILNFDERLCCGEPELISGLTKSNGKICLMIWSKKSNKVHFTVREFFALKKPIDRSIIK